MLVVSEGLHHHQRDDQRKHDVFVHVTQPNRPVRQSRAQLGGHLLLRDRRYSRFDSTVPWASVGGVARKGCLTEASQTPFARNPKTVSDVEAEQVPVEEEWDEGDLSQRRECHVSVFGTVPGMGPPGQDGAGQQSECEDRRDEREA